MNWIPARNKKWILLLSLLLLFLVVTIGLQWYHSPAVVSPSAVEKLRELTVPKSTSHVAVCEPRRHVYFMKTHKCGSTTVQRVFLKRAWLHNLTTVFAKVPRRDKHGASPNIRVDSLFKASYILPHPSNAYEVFCLHARFNAPEVAKLMPSDTKYVSVLRDPANMFASSYRYYELSLFTKVPLETFVVNPSVYARKVQSPLLKGFLRNSMLFDAGLSRSSFDNRTSILEKIGEIEKHFDLIIINAYFDEGLVLLKELMCWSLEDVAVLDNNMQASAKPILPELKLKLDNWNSGDVLYYEHFKSVMILKIESFGKERMNRAVRDLRAMRKILFNKCVQKLIPGKEIKNVLFRPYGTSKGYVLNPETEKDEECQVLAMAELPILTLLREKQYKIKAPYSIQLSRNSSVI